MRTFRTLILSCLSFVLGRDPGIDGANWPLFTSERQEYVALNSNHTEQRSMLNAKECRLWNVLLPKMQGVAGETNTDDLSVSTQTPSRKRCIRLYQGGLLLFSLFRTFYPATHPPPFPHSSKGLCGRRGGLVITSQNTDHTPGGKTCKHLSTAFTHIHTYTNTTRLHLHVDDFTSHHITHTHTVTFCLE